MPHHIKLLRSCAASPFGYSPAPWSIQSIHSCKVLTRGVKPSIEEVFQPVTPILQLSNVPMVPGILLAFPRTMPHAKSYSDICGLCMDKWKVSHPFTSMRLLGD